MTTIDVIILILVGLGVVQGLMKGAIKQLAVVVGFIAGLLLARALFGMLAERIAPMIGASMTVAQVLSFFIIWIIVPIGCGWIASVITSALDVIHLGWLNRLLGGIIGAVKVMLFVALVIHAIEYIDTKEEFISKSNKEVSLLYMPVRDLTSQLFPEIKDAAQKII